jgi:hypothetical protein
VVAPAPDLSIVPNVPVAMRVLVRTASRQLRSVQIKATLAEGGRVADAESRTAAHFAQDAALFSTDSFHPSSAGYALIARFLVPPVLAALEDLDREEPAAG